MAATLSTFVILLLSLLLFLPRTCEGPDFHQRREIPPFTEGVNGALSPGFSSFPAPAVAPFSVKEQ
ncbi:hypothetical protein DVH24_038883 [Malus domestica]|uniref:Uncharacterized protein n=1 Tax=Malus domestica TaxID=3750 RepID=A0A498KB76_MALDO|nr:hypothetical protein DVH24_038881 [Malus domestica]RXI04609.1 hypothetical protein DVH24_038883 [Malus domestica]